MAEIHGGYDERFTGVAETLSANLDRGLDIGASVAVIATVAYVMNRMAGGLVGDKRGAAVAMAAAIALVRG